MVMTLYISTKKNQLIFFYILTVAGFESPFAIQGHHNKVQMDQSGSDLKPQQLEFVLKRKTHQQGNFHVPITYSTVLYTYMYMYY